MMRALALLVAISLLPCFCYAQGPLLAETNKKEYVISPKGTLDDFELTITNKGVSKRADEAYIALHAMPAGSSWFDLTYEGQTYRIRNVSYYYDNLEIGPASMKCRLIIVGPECVPGMAGYLLEKRNKITWKFNTIRFGKTGEQVDWSKVKDPDAIIEVLASYSFPYVARQDFLDKRAKGNNMVSTGTFVIKCPKKWFLDLSKRKIEEADLPAQ